MATEEFALTSAQEMTPDAIDRYEGTRDKIAGVLLGAAVADALGWPTEFVKTSKQAEQLFKVSEVRDFVPWEKRTGGRFNTYIDYIQPGEYSDDTQLTLCTARCILPDGTFDAERFSKKELRHWPDYARGAGGTVTRAAKAIGRRDASWDNNFFAFQSRGRSSEYVNAGANGGAMRVAPHALANIFDESAALRGIWRNVVITHGHPRALWGALLYGKCLLVLLNWRRGSLETFIDNLSLFVQDLDLSALDGGMEGWLARWRDHAHRSFEEAFDETRREVLDTLTVIHSARTQPLRETYKALGCFEPATKGSGTGTVAAAIALFVRHGGNYEHAVLNAINMYGSDTDTIGAMVGAMAGALKGQMAIPDRWVNVMQDYGYFARATEAMTRISVREAVSNDLEVTKEREEAERQDRDIVTLAKGRQVYKGQRVTHPLLGMGWVIDAHAQQIRRRDGGTMLLARVGFDVGQSCIFRSYQSSRTKDR